MQEPLPFVVSENALFLSLQLDKMAFSGGMDPVSWLFQSHNVVSWLAPPTVAGKDPDSKLSLRISIDNRSVNKASGRLSDSWLKATRSKGRWY